MRPSTATATKIGKLTPCLLGLAFAAMLSGCVALGGGSHPPQSTPTNGAANPAANTPPPAVTPPPVAPPVPPTPPPPTNPPPVAGSINSVNHIIFMLQENRSFDSYFGKLNDYVGSQVVDGIPSLSTSSCDGLHGCNYDLAGNPFTMFHLQTACIDNMDPDWLPAHGDFNLYNPGSNEPLLDGFAKNAGVTGEFGSSSGESGTASTAIPSTTTFRLMTALGKVLATVTVPTDGSAPSSTTTDPKITLTANPSTTQAGGTVTVNWDAPGYSNLAVTIYYDTLGHRVMGYYDSGDIPYYYFLAKNFATSDRWFSPMMGNSPPNRVFAFAATTHGHAHNPGSLSVPTIWHELQSAGVSWKIYYNDKDPTTGGPATTLNHWYSFVQANSSHLVPLSQYFTDVQNGTLPAVAFIEQKSGFDDHPGSKINIQNGTKFVSSLVNALMASPSWKDSVFLLTFDEDGGLFDHVSPQPMPSPDGIKPTDLLPQDVQDINPPADFTVTGFRVPMLVISPFTRKGFVSHTIADNTAILKFIETRFKLPNLTARDAYQMDMQEFFDFATPPWLTPPTGVPAQPTNLPCDPTLLP